MQYRLRKGWDIKNKGVWSTVDLLIGIESGPRGQAVRRSPSLSILWNATTSHPPRLFGLKGPWWYCSQRSTNPLMQPRKHLYRSRQICSAHQWHCQGVWLGRGMTRHERRRARIEELKNSLDEWTGTDGWLNAWLNDWVCEYIYIYACMKCLLLCCSRFKVLIYWRMTKYKTDYICSMFADSEHSMFLSERILECMFWQHILDLSYEVLYWLVMRWQVESSIIY